MHPNSKNGYKQNNEVSEKNSDFPETTVRKIQSHPTKGIIKRIFT